MRNGRTILRENIARLEHMLYFRKSNPFTDDMYVTQFPWSNNHVYYRFFVSPSSDVVKLPLIFTYSTEEGKITPPTFDAKPSEYSRAMCSYIVNLNGQREEDLFRVRQSTKSPFALDGELVIDSIDRLATFTQKDKEKQFQFRIEQMRKDKKSLISDIRTRGDTLVRSSVVLLNRITPELRKKLR